MKTKETVLLSCFCAYLCVAPVLALDATGSATNSSLDKGAKQLIEKLASKAEETRKKDQKAYVGIITKVSDATITVASVVEEEKNYSIKVDDTLTAIYRIVGTTKKELKKSDLKVGDYVIVTGLMLNDTLEAMEIYIDEQFIVKTATITEVNKSDYYLKVITYDKDAYILDIQSSTRQFMLNTKTKEIEKSGFSKIKEGDTVHFVVSKTNPGLGKEKNRYDAVRILVIPQEFTAQ